MTRNEKIKMWVARLYCASGCSCCRDDDGWKLASDELGKLLGVYQYDDGSGYDFYSLKKQYEEQAKP